MAYGKGKMPNVTKYHLARIVEQAGKALKDLENGETGNLKRYVGRIKADSGFVNEILEGKRDESGRKPGQVRFSRISGLKSRTTGNNYGK